MEKSMAEMAALLVLPEKWAAFLLGGRGRLTSVAHHLKEIELISEAYAAAAAPSSPTARSASACAPSSAVGGPALGVVAVTIALKAAPTRFPQTE